MYSNFDKKAMINSKKFKISEIKLNPNNPRYITEDKFKNLVKSIKDFPEMLDLRPIVVNSDMVILGGNMRFKACIEAGLKEIPIIVADNITEEQQKEFLIKDNVSGGVWDFDVLANEWDAELLNEWGLDVPVLNEPEEEEEEKTYIPTYKFEVSCSTELEKNKLMAKLLTEGYSCTDDY